MPLMSVVIAARDGLEGIAVTLDHLGRQSVREQLEIVVVVPAGAAPRRDDPALEGFARVQWIEVPQIESIGGANASGVRAASAEVVVLAEDHCFPEPDWAEGLIAAHRGPWSAVGPALLNANPSSAVSQADFLIGYGPWIAPVSSGEVDFLPGHNSSYKREVLLAYGERLESLMDAETLLHWDLRARGQRLYLDSAVRARHMNFSRWRPWLGAQFHSGRLFGGLRAQSMAAYTRAVFVLGSPLIPALRLIRLLRSQGKAVRRRPACILPLIVGFTVDGVGQMLGYLLGPGNARARVSRYEFNRLSFVTAEDRARVLGRR